MPNPAGTFRPGNKSRGGRKKGSKNKRSKFFAERAAARGVQPIDVMLRTMRTLVKCADARGLDETDKLKFLERAAIVAKDAAPYLHPRLQTTTAQGPGDGVLKVRIVD